MEVYGVTSSANSMEQGNKGATAQMGPFSN
jgi:hypothetical protein